MSFQHWTRPAIATVMAVGIFVAAIPLVTANIAPVSPKTWTVAVGTQNANRLFDTSFFPNMITIDAGDTISFTGAHQVINLPGKGGGLPSYGTASAIQAVGPGTYDGSTYTASGVLGPEPYSVTFTKPGVYAYYDLLHPGMMGVVVVHPVGTEYPETQQQYDVVSKAEESTDLKAGEAALKTVRYASQDDKNGTSTYFAQIGLPDATSGTFAMSPVDASGIRGTGAWLASSTASGRATGYSVSGTLTGLKAHQIYSLALEAGSLGDRIGIQNATFRSVVADAKGTARFSGTIQSIGMPQGIWRLDAYNPDGKLVATGSLSAPSYTLDAFVPQILRVHDGDTVLWKQVGSHGIDTVTAMPASPGSNVGTSTVDATYGIPTMLTENANESVMGSSPLENGDTYQVTYTEPGTYKYESELSDGVSMSTEVIVLPNPAKMTVVTQRSVTNLPIQHIGKAVYVKVSDVVPLLNGIGVKSTWDGAALRMTLADEVPSNNTISLSGMIHFYANGTLVGNAPAQQWTNPETGEKDTYVCVSDLQNVLTPLGVNSSFDGNTWSLLPSS